MVVGEAHGEPVHAWLGLQVEEGIVNVRLYPTAAAAAAPTLAGVQRLVELALGKDLAWLERDLRAVQKLAPRSTLSSERPRNCSPRRGCMFEGTSCPRARCRH